MLHKVKLFLVLAFSYTGFVTYQTLSLATPAPTHIAQAINFIPPPPPADPPPGGRLRGGARRDTCPAVKPELTALVPSNQEPPSVTNVWGLATETHPTFWFYMPYTKDVDYPTEFILQDEDLNPIYQQAIALPDQPGIISISLPSNAPPLALETRYRWFLTINCNQQKQSPPIYVEGVIKRIDLNQKITQELQTATPLQQVAIYAKNGIWHEALTTLAKLRRQKPQDATLKTQWRDFLNSIGLDDIAEEPILGEKN
ncbi:MAG: DUF928 domain-containing protein [Nostoc sp. LLA-1]|nr:DUF928 domain-containing protein [Cyanocohniella sp. LLY]